MTSYQFPMPDDEWVEWKKTVTRTKTLDTRIVEVLNADADDRIIDEDEIGDPALWSEWKYNLPRDVTPGERLWQLVVADMEGRVLEPDDDRLGEPSRETDSDVVVQTTGLRAGTPADHPDAEDGPTLEDAREVAEGFDLSPAEVDAVLEAWKHLKERGQSRRAAFVDEVYPEADAGYASRNLKNPERAWWKKFDEFIAALPGVQPPESEGSHWWHWDPDAPARDVDEEGGEGGA